MSKQCSELKMSRHARLMQTASSKLAHENNLLILTGGEFCAVRDLMNTAFDFLTKFLAQHPKTRKRTLSLRYQGTKYRIQYSALAGIFICLPGSTVRLTPRAFFL
jgi:glycerol-3-phosphate dehydrogenase